MSALPVAAAPMAPTALGNAVVRHLQAQIDSARRLLQSVLQQGVAVRKRDVDGVLARLAEVQSEMDRRSTLEHDRTIILTHAGAQLGLPAHAVTLDAMTVLLTPSEGEQARANSAELRGLLAEVQREHTTNRVLMRQELAFLSHLTRHLGLDGEDVGYRPPSEPGATMRATVSPGAQTVRIRRVLDLEA